MEHLEDDEVEVTDLEPLGNASNSMSSWLASIVLDWQRALQSRRSRRRWRVGSAMGVLLLLITLFTLNHGPFAFLVKGFSTPLVQAAGASSPLAAMPSLTQMDRIACPAFAARSPDTHFMAVLGYRNCPNPQDSYAAHLLDLYDACSGRLIRQLHPDGAIARRFNESLPPRVRHALEKDGSDLPVIAYEQILWSPDSQHLALPFALVTQQPPPQGVLLLNSDGGSEQVLLQPTASGVFSLKWDLIAHPGDRPVSDRMALLQNPCLAEDYW